jgi:hypothetical protein
MPYLLEYGFILYFCGNNNSKQIGQAVDRTIGMIEYV